jgi:putative spermidine/putrescine transport system permease protein
VRSNGPVALGYHVAFLGFLIAPLVAVCLTAFTPEPYLSIPWDGFSLRWFRAIPDRPEFVHAIWLSLRLAIVSATIATLLAVPAALAVARYRFLGRAALVSLLMSPLMIPQLVLGIAFLRFFTLLALAGTFPGLVISHVVVVMPFVLHLVIAAATGLDQALEEAARSLGATPLTAFRRIVLPLIFSGIAAGWLIAFVVSFDEVTMTIFIAAPGTVTLPVAMFNHVQETLDPVVASVSALLVAGMLVLVSALDRIMGIDHIFKLGRQY